MPTIAKPVYSFRTSVFRLEQFLSDVPVDSRTRDHLKSLSGRLPQQLKASHVTSQVWRKALDLVEAAVRARASDCALGLLLSDEYERLAQRADQPAQYTAALNDLLLRNGALKDNLRIARAVRNAFTTADSPETLRSKVREMEAERPPIMFKLTLAMIGALLGALPENDAADGWNWRDDNWWQVKWNLPNPWSQGNRAGIELDDCLPSDGWELYIRRILNTDGLASVSGLTPALANRQKHFALYNARTGTLRVFIYFESQQPADRLVVRAFVSQGPPQNPLSTHGLFNHIGPIARAATQSRKLTDNTIYYYTSLISPGWVVLDFPLAYDPLMEYGAGPFYLNVCVDCENVANISVNGQFGIKVPVESPNFSLLGWFQTLLAPLLNVGGEASSLEKTGQKLRNLGNSMNDSGGDGSALVVLGTSLASAKWPVAGVLAGTQIIRTLLGFGSSGNVKYATYEGTLNLEGQIRDESFSNYVALLLKDTSDAPIVDLPYYFKKYRFGDLGFFQMDRLPLIKLSYRQGTRTWPGGGFSYDLRADLEDCLSGVTYVNPASSLTLRDTKVQLIIQRPWWDHERKRPWDKAIALKLGPGIVLEPDLTRGDHLDRELEARNATGMYDPPTANLFPNSFEAAKDYNVRLYVAHGTASSTEGDMVGLVGDRRLIATAVQLRVMRHFVKGGSADGQVIECILTYACDDIYWVGGAVPGVENLLPPFNGI
jgi:hypothetical protein